MLNTQWNPKGAHDLERRQKRARHRREWSCSWRQRRTWEEPQDAKHAAELAETRRFQEEEARRTRTEQRSLLGRITKFFRRKV